MNALKESIRRGYIKGVIEEIQRAEEFKEDAAMPDALTRDERLAKDLFYAGAREDGYAFFGWKPDGGALIIMAGCHTYSVAEAQDYWSGEGSRRAQSRALVDLILGWASGTVQPIAVRKKTAERVPVEVVYEFLGPKLAVMFRNWAIYTRSDCGGLPHPEILATAGLTPRRARSG